jgi:hypothetical protein
MEKLIENWQARLDEYKILVEEYEAKDSMNYEDTETYGAYLGKIEILEEVIEKIMKFY